MKRKMEEKKMEDKRKRISIPLYEDEFEKVAEELSIEKGDVTRESVRLALGLKSSGRKVGATKQIRDKLKDMSEEQRIELLDKLTSLVDK